MACAADTQWSVPLNLTHAAGKTAASIGIICTVDFGNIAFGILYHILTLYYISALQTHLATGSQTEELLWRILHKVVAFYVYLPRERHLVCACGAVLRIVFHLYSLSLTFGIVGDNDFHGIHHSHHSCSNPVEVITHRMLKTDMLLSASTFVYPIRFTKLRN